LCQESQEESYDKAFKATKLEIDKQFWHTINTIKVRGGGATDFAIVKDDVGNWYVKGLSSDPESIIKSAQSLALFNMGGKVNLNLLGQIEDRRELAKLNIDNPKRGYLQDKLDAKQSGSGANTSALGKVLDKYRKEYVAATTTDVDGLIGKLDQLPIDITAAWKDINFNEPKDANLKILTDLLVSPAELAAAKKALEAAQTDPDKARPGASVTAPKDPAVAKIDPTKTIKSTAQDSSTAKAISEAAHIKASNAIVKSLIELRNMRSRLVKAIIQNDDLITTQRTKYIEEKTKLDTQNIVVTTQKNIWEKANANVTNAQTLFDAMTAPAAVAKKREALTASEKKLEERQKALIEAHTAHDNAVIAMRDILKIALKNKNDAQVKVDTVEATNADGKKLAEEGLIKAKDDLAKAETDLTNTLIPSEAVIARTKERNDAEFQQKIQQGIFDGLTASSEVENARGILTAATTARDTVKIAWDAANTTLAAQSTLAKAADDAYTLAKSNRLAAARKVSALANSLIETTTTNRLEAVKAYEVAIGFVGQTAGGQ